MRRTTLSAFIVACLLCGQASSAFSTEAANGLTPEQALGRMLYSEKDLSLNRNQSCQSCHHPDAGFADPKNAADPFRLPVSEGTNPGMFGGRNAPSAAYAAYSPGFTWDQAARRYVGGQFWDGRAKTLEEQAGGPPMNPVEMAMPGKDVVGERLASRPEYVQAFKSVYGMDPAKASPQEVFDRMAQAIAAYERSAEVCAFTSKFDAWLAGQASLNRMELMGYRFFLGAGCANCHTAQPGRAPDGSLSPPVFTDFSYHNLGLPKNLALPGGASAKADLGLGGVEAVRAADPEGLQRGRFKVPTLRNVARTAPYGHNGVFRTLEEIVWFYNTRDMLPPCPEGGAASARPCWRAPEVAENVNRTDMGRLGMCRMQVRGIVAFLNTLTDGWIRPGASMSVAYRP
ncbi:cytochrome-c peroxidase [Fundidesulfovibrio agrisoli]|uniref:cytochrome-c peroxidase n=1 Tax=Fundidesulfovibrio agrisoli TaxID=2922717 RepID=UPI001FADA83A|nr:cytochrome c peroxidase [Fundidesulfovibrio agrisoli]